MVSDPWHRRWQRHVAGLAGAAVLGTAAVAAVQTTDWEPSVSDAHADALAESLLAGANSSVSRDLERAPLTSVDQANATVDGTMFTQRATTVRSDASGASAALASLDRAARVKVTGETSGDWTQIVHKTLPRWVRTTDLASTAPRLSPTEGGVSSAPCRLGTGVERGLRPDTVRVYRAVCARYPEVVRYGGASGGGEHGTGQALDIMVSGALGHEIAAFLQAHRAELGVSYLIYEQRIWTLKRAADGWRTMKNRGSRTANHFDHVHVTTIGNSGTS